MRVLALLCLVALAAAQDDTESPKPPTYENFGCYRDTGERDLSVLVEAKVTTIYRCRDMCRRLKYRYAGIQYYNYCFCGNRYGRYGKDDDSACNAKCHGNKKEICGGLWHSNIYATGVSRAARELRTLGCYKDTGARDLPFLSAGSANVNSCVQRCGNLGYRYAGVQAGAYCFCGNEYGKYGKTHDAECATPCSANKHQICGGTWHSLIYETDFKPVERESLGCYKDTGVRDLPDYISSVMSVQFCISHCSKLGYKYAGLQYYSYCFCGNSYGKYGKAPESNCRLPCNGKKDEICGGVWRSSIYATGRDAEEFHSLGCFHDKGVRDLPWLAKSGLISLNNCRHKCASHGYLYFGVQNSNLCFCGNSYGKYGKAADNQCHKPCVANKKQVCGGYFLQNVYRTHVKAHMGSDSGHSSQRATDSRERSLEQSVSSDRTGKLMDISQMKMRKFGCFRDNGGERDLPQMPYVGALTVHYCRWSCRQLNYRYFGVQAASYCFCGNHFGKYGQGHDSKCSYKCSANKDQICGGASYNTLYSSGITEEQGELTSLGCYVDQGARDLPQLGASGAKISPKFCVKTCKDLGYKYAGTQASAYCFCGNKYGTYGKAKTSDCYYRCNGNRRQMCGGSWRSHIYETKADISNPEKLGCYKDTGVRDLPELAKVGKMSINYCRKLCRDLGYRYAGVQFGSYCFCGNKYGRHGKVEASKCNTKCSGHHDQICGGAWHNNIYESGRHQFVFKSFGCYNDKSIRDLKYRAVIARVTLNNCRQACWRFGYRYFGVQNSNLCYCGDSYGKYGKVEDVMCHKPCLGNKEQTCGAVWLNNIYGTGVGTDDEGDYGRGETPTEAPKPEPTEAPKPEPQPEPTEAPKPEPRPEPTSTTETEITEEDLQKMKVGCFKDQADRDLPTLAQSSNSMTIRKCIGLCNARQFRFAGVQNSVECWCGNEFGKHGRAESPTKCDNPCGGKSSTMCGGDWYNSIYTTSVEIEHTSTTYIETDPKIITKTDTIVTYYDEFGNKLNSSTTSNVH